MMDVVVKSSDQGAMLILVGGVLVDWEESEMRRRLGFMLDGSGRV